jgi:hypothetical protein
MTPSPSCDDVADRRLRNTELLGNLGMHHSSSNQSSDLMDGCIVKARPLMFFAPRPVSHPVSTLRLHISHIVGRSPGE